MRERSLVGKAKFESYYGKPIVREPVWKPQVPWYLWTGGISGAASLVALGARLAGLERLRFRAGIVSGVGAVANPLLLVTDLGRPQRFHHMLRVFKPTSPMSVGSWILTASGGASGTAALCDLFGVFPRLRRAAEGIAGLTGAPLATYTGALLSDSVIPVWHEARRELPLLFGASGAAAGGGICAALAPLEEAGPARRLALLGGVVELATAHAMERRLGYLAQPYREGVAGRCGKLAKLSSAAGVAVLAVGGRRRAGAVVGGTLLATGSALLRQSVFHAGKASAADPAYTVRMQKERLARGEGARTEPRHVEQPPDTRGERGYPG